MSTIRKVSQEYRSERARIRALRAQAAQQTHTEQILSAVKAGMIKVRPPILPESARMVFPREELKERLGEGHLNPFKDGHRKLAYRNQRTGADKPYELRTYARRPERNKYAGYYSPGTWMEPNGTK